MKKNAAGRIALVSFILLLATALSFGAENPKSLKLPINLNPAALSLAGGETPWPGIGARLWETPAPAGALNLSQVAPAASPTAFKRIRHELTLMGSFMSGSGTSEAGNFASDLFTYPMSPFFGAGYQNFVWTGSHPPEPLDDVLRGPFFKPTGGLLFGFRFAINVTPRIQIEFAMDGGGFGLDFTDEVWEAVHDFLEDAVKTLRGPETAPFYTDDSVRRGTETGLVGFNLNYALLKEGPFIPYVTLGFCSVMNGDNPMIDVDLVNDVEGHGRVKYILMIVSEEASGLSPVFGAGMKAYFVKTRNAGIKLEARVIPSRITFQRTLSINFDADSWAFVRFRDYFGPVAEETISRTIFKAGLGLFFGW